MTPFFTAENVRVAYEARYHFGWYFHGRGELRPEVRATLETALREVCEKQSYHLLEVDCQPCVVRALLSLKPETSPAEATRFVKGNLAVVARREHGLADLWSRGWFLRSVGHVTNDTVRHYVDHQYDSRNSPGGDPSRAAQACYASDGNPSELRSASHARYEYNAHFVFVTHRRRELIDLDVAEALVAYLRQVCAKKQWLIWNMEFVWNHVHLFLGLTPSDAPGEVALSLLNNAEYFLQKRFAAALKDEVERTVWQPGYYLGTVGSATTAQVKAYLGRRDGV
jgi:putative transposase